MTLTKVTHCFRDSCVSECLGAGPKVRDGNILTRHEHCATSVTTQVTGPPWHDLEDVHHPNFWVSRRGPREGGGVAAGGGGERDRE